MKLEELKNWFYEFRSNWKKACVLLCLAAGLLIIGVYVTSYVSEKAKKHALTGNEETVKNEISSQKETPDKEPTIEKPSSLHDFFKSDFSNYLAANRGVGIRIFTKGSEPKIKQDYELEFRLHCDFESSTKLFSVFLPSSTFPNAATTICKVIAEQSRDIASRLSEGMIVTMSRFDDRMTEINDLIFSGRVYIYHEAFFSNDEIDELRFFFRQKNLDHRFRGQSYLVKRHLYEKN
jgi:hypothetical protein